MTDWIEKNGLKRRLVFTPGWDERKTRPGGGGQHNMHLAFVLQGPRGALVFDLATGWYIDRVQSPNHPFPWGLVIHWHVEHDLHSNEIRDSCDWLDGAPCVAQDLAGLSSPVLERLLTKLVSEGEEALWTELEVMYSTKASEPAHVSF